MKIIVCLKEVVDTRLSLDSGLRNRVVFREGLPRRLNPNDAAALATALRLKEAAGPSPVAISLITIGPPGAESYLRDGLALGADEAMRIREEEFSELSSYQKARLLARSVSLFGADLVFTGAVSLDTASCQVGPLMAAWLRFPCVGEVIQLEMGSDGKSVLLTRDIGRGNRERMQCCLPAVITVKGEEKLPYASLDKLIESQSAEIGRISPADLDLSHGELKDSPTRNAGLIFPRPRTKRLPAPASSLPAFERILQLLEGGISRREGTRLEGSGAELADKLFELLQDEGILAAGSEPDKHGAN